LTYSTMRIGERKKEKRNTRYFLPGKKNRQVRSFRAFGLELREKGPRIQKSSEVLAGTKRGANEAKLPHQRKGKEKNNNEKRSPARAEQV